MKSLYIFFLSIVFAGSVFGQTAVNFNCADCNGTSHDLYSELDAGKVIVLCWVMPCSSCIGPSKTTYNVVQSYQTNYPGRVNFYLVDDLANTNCTSLNSWANTQLIYAGATSQRFSNVAIKMTDYGTAGMPKIVVIGGPNHDVFYNSNNSVDATALQTAIDNALASTSGISANSANTFAASLFPSPADENTTLTIFVRETSKAIVEVYNMIGNKASEVTSNILYSGENKINLDTEELSNGLYFVKISVNNQTKILKINIAH
jgi:hypothetical protein